MKWIELSKAKNIEFNKVLFLKSDGEKPDSLKWYYAGKLVEIKQTDKGLVHTFEIATFDGESESPVYLTTEITHIAIPK